MKFIQVNVHMFFQIEYASVTKGTFNFWLVMFYAGVVDGSLVSEHRSFSSEFLVAYIARDCRGTLRLVKFHVASPGVSTDEVFFAVIAFKRLRTDVGPRVKC